MPTAYKVSTITAVATVSTCVDLNLFFDNLDVGPGKAIVFAGKGAHGAVRTRGVRPNRPKKSVVRFFDHQVTVVYNTDVLHSDGITRSESHNIKVFHNGNLQLTGVKSLEGGQRAVKHIAQILGHIASFCPDVLPLGLVNAPPVAANFRACLINSDFHAGYVLRRDQLYSLASGPVYSMRCVFETYYPGVKVQYMWNERHKVTGKKGGVCQCACPCTGKGDGGSNGNCRKITVSVFQSGCCIITGAHTYEQLDDAHAFLSKMFVDHRASLALHM